MILLKYPNKPLKKELAPSSNNLLWITEEQRTLPNLFYMISITLIWKPDKDTTKRKLKINISHEI